MRPTIDERMDQWLNLMADHAQIPDEDRQRFMDFMRGTTAFAAMRVQLAAADLWDDTGVPQWVRRFLAWLDRRLP